MKRWNLLTKTYETKRENNKNNSSVVDYVSNYKFLKEITKLIGEKKLIVNNEIRYQKWR